MSGAGMSGAGMSGAGMSGAGMSDAGMSDAGMSGAGMSGAGMSGAGMSGAGMSGAGMSDAGMSGAGMSGAGMSDAGMSGAGMSGAGMSGAGMSGAGMSGAGMSGAGMSGEGMSGAGMSGAGMSGAGMSGAGMSGAGMSGAGMSDAGMRHILSCWHDSYLYPMCTTPDAPREYFKMSGGLRAQIDREQYRRNTQNELRNTKGLTIIESSVEDLVMAEGEGKPKVAGVSLGTGEIVRGQSVVITTGTFLRGQIFLGLDSYPAGRRGDEPAIGLAKTLEEIGFAMGRLRTGTPPRIDKDTINYSILEIQYGDDPIIPFSFLNEHKGIKLDQMVCHLTHTNMDTHQIVLDNLALSTDVAELDSLLRKVEDQSRKGSLVLAVATRSRGGNNTVQGKEGSRGQNAAHKEAAGFGCHA
ncbi:hypothetical protein EMCRGX_G021455 [Ephydatia muelleri]